MKTILLIFLFNIAQPQSVLIHKSFVNVQTCEAAFQTVMQNTVSQVGPIDSNVRITHFCVDANSLVDAVGV